MPYFPQFATGAVSQFPCTKRLVRRTVTNATEDGGLLKIFDPGGSMVEWDLELSGLNANEWGELDNLFESAEGQLGAFVFLDPFSNLLAWSEDLTAAVWSSDSGLTVNPGVADGFGGNRASRLQNQSQAEAGVRQTIAVPAWFQYCLSLYARSDQPCEVRLSAAAGQGTASTQFPAGPTWRRFESATQPGGQAEAVTFGVSVEAGSAVEIYGLQAEPQRGASAYKKTTTRNALYTGASFATDELTLQSDSANEYSCRVRIRALG